jgi:LPXTG-motif cell wall-anchored protein
MLLEAFKFKEGDFTYSITDGQVTITGYTGDGGDIVIPAEFGSYPVTGIGEAAFSAKGLTSIVLPDSLANIGDQAFDANQLSSLTIPDSVTSIGKHAFNYNQLNEVYLPGSVISIGPWAFENIQRDPAELTIYGIAGSAAETYAKENGHTFVDTGGGEDPVTPVWYLYIGLVLLVLAGGIFALMKKKKALSGTQFPKNSKRDTAL